MGLAPALGQAELIGEEEEQQRAAKGHSIPDIRPREPKNRISTDLFSERTNLANRISFGITIWQSASVPVIWRRVSAQANSLSVLRSLPVQCPVRGIGRPAFGRARSGPGEETQW